MIKLLILLYGFSNTFLEKFAPRTASGPNEMTRQGPVIFTFVLPGQDWPNVETGVNPD